MSFLWPQAFWLALAPLLWAGASLVAAWRRGKRRSPATTAAPDAAPHIRRGLAAQGRVRFASAAERAGRRPWRFWLAFLLAVTALARPQWGDLDAPPDAAVAGEVLIALDLSRSMLARDVAPSRLERARLVATELAAALPERKIGLIGFAGTAHLLAPVSEDRAVFDAFVSELRPEHLVQQGSDFGALFEVVLAGFSPQAPARVLVLLTDGEAAPGPWRERLEPLRAAGVRVVAVGVATPGGAAVPAEGGRALQTGEGAPVVSRLNQAVLGEIARATGGRTLGLAQRGALAAAVVAASARGFRTADASAATGAAPAQRADRFAEVLALALLLLASSAAGEWTARPRLRCRRATAAGVAQPALALLLLAVLLQPGASQAARTTPRLDLHGQEPDPLKRVNEVVARLVAKPRLTAADYLQLVEAATRYGEIHRGHGHPLAEGVLRDGVAAVEQGRRLDPDLADWAAAKAKLERLLVPPPPIPEVDPGPVDPANEPLDAGSPPPPPGAESEGEPEPDEEKPTAGEQGLRNVGGGKRDTYDEAEWRNPALVQPLAELERLRAVSSPAELFRLRQQAAPRAPRRSEQTW